MKHLYFHIGTHKTGTTSIQGFMDRASSELQKQGILYPTSGRPLVNGSRSTGHHLLAWSLRHEALEVWRTLREEIEAWPGDRVVISAEGMGNLDARQCLRIPHLLPGYQVHTLIYFRNRLVYMLSAYKQAIKSGRYAGDFRSYLEAYGRSRDYEDLINRWAAISCPNGVYIRVFDKAKDTTGLEADFAQAIGAAFGPLSRYCRPPENVSPSERTIAMMARINRVSALLPNRFGRKVGQRLRRHLNEPTPLGSRLRALLSVNLRETLASEDDIAWFRAQMLHKNEQFVDRYVDQVDRHYFGL